MINPNAIAMIWALTILMAGAIAIGAPALIYTVGGLVVAYTLVAILT